MNPFEFIAQLQEEYYFSVEWLEGEDWREHASADLLSRVAYCPRPDNGAAEQAAMLHEIGHLMNLNVPVGEMHAYMLTVEADAWLWAIQHYHHPDVWVYYTWNDDTVNSILWAVNTYWRNQQLMRYKGGDSDSWERMIHYLGAQYDPVLNVWEPK